MSNIVFMGEPLVEFNNMKGESTQFLKGYGGDTSNAAIAAARQGAKCRYLSAIGDDIFGREFLELWISENIDVDFVKVDYERPTGIYFVKHTSQGHEFSYYRANSAASMISAADIDAKCFSRSQYLHVSGISQAISPSACDAVFKAIEVAKEKGVKVSYDLNYRPKLWPLPRARSIINATIELSDIIFPSLEDSILLTGLDDPEKIIYHYLSMGVGVVVLKCGKDGAIVGDAESLNYIKPAKVSVVDATGAGDCFDGAFLAQCLNGANYLQAAEYANCAAALSTRGYGAVEPIPKTAEVECFMRDL